MKAGGGKGRICLCRKQWMLTNKKQQVTDSSRRRKGPPCFIGDLSPASGRQSEVAAGPRIAPFLGAGCPWTHRSLGRIRCPTPTMSAK